MYRKFNVRVTFFKNVFQCCSLIKEETRRPKYNKLLEHSFIKKNDEAKLDPSLYIREILNRMENSGAIMFTMNQPWMFSILFVCAFYIDGYSRDIFHTFSIACYMKIKKHLII